MRVYNFNDVIGNVASVSVIRQSLVNDMFPHVSVFSGVYGTGKSTCAEIASLYLTCEAPKDGNPCLVCPQCRKNLSALTNTGKSNRLSKVNVGRMDKKTGIKELIKEVFDLQMSEQQMVYVIEEAHALDDAQQTALLEEIDRLPDNVYIIFCTTKPTRLLPELRSRAISFNFTRLSGSESSALFELLCIKKKIGVKDDAIKNMILGYAKGIPRTMVNLLDFICSNEFETKTIAEFLGIIDNDEFLFLFEAINSSDLFVMLNALDGIMNKSTRDTFIEQLKNFMLSVVFMMEGSVFDRFTSTDYERIHAIFDGKDVLKIASIIESIKYNAEESEVKFKLLQVRKLLEGKNLSSVVRENKVQAVVQTKVAQESREELVGIEHGASVELHDLDFEFLAGLK